MVLQNRYGGIIGLTLNRQGMKHREITHVNGNGLISEIKPGI